MTFCTQVRYEGQMQVGAMKSKALFTSCPKLKQHIIQKVCYYLEKHMWIVLVFKAMTASMYQQPV
jgi:hypothetical protein